MRHVLCKTVRKHVELIASVTKMLNPLHLVATIVDETLIEERHVTRSLQHTIGLQVFLSEAGNWSVRYILGNHCPIGRKIVLGEREG